MYLLCGHQPFEFPCTYIHLYIHAHIRCTCTGSRVEDKLHKQHCLEASAKFQLNTTAFMCYDWAFKSCKVQSGFPFSAALREWESVGIWLFMQLACVPFLCQGSKWLNGKSVWLLFKKSWVWIPAGSRIVFPVDLIYHLSAKTSLFCPSNTLVVYNVIFQILLVQCVITLWLSI